MDKNTEINLDLDDIECYITGVIDYLENKNYYDNCDWYDFDELLAYFKSTLELIEEIRNLINY